MGAGQSQWFWKIVRVPRSSVWFAHLSVTHACKHRADGLLVESRLAVTFRDAT